MAAANETYELSLEDYFSIVTELTSEISIEDDEEPFNEEDLISLCPNPALKMYVARTEMAQDDQDAQDEDENGETAEEQEDKTSLKRAIKAITDFQNSSRFSDIREAKAGEAYEAAIVHLNSTEDGSNTSDVDEITLACREIKRLATILSIIMPAAEPDLKTFKTCMKLTENVFKGNYATLSTSEHRN